MLLKGPITRAQTHDLLASVIEHLGGTLKEIIVNDLVDGTFYAKLVVEQDGQEIEVDSRPSDAIALGVAENVPIYVAEQVLAQTEADASPDFDLESDDEFDFE